MLLEQIYALQKALNILIKSTDETESILTEVTESVEFEKFKELSSSSTSTG